MTETTTETNAEPAAPEPTSAKKGRGPTRKTIIACDLADEIAGLDEAVRAVVLQKLREGVPAASVREDARKQRAWIKSTEEAAATLDRIAKLLQTADSLPELQRGFVIAALEAVEKRGE